MANRMPGSVHLTLLAVLEKARMDAVEEGREKSIEELQKLYEEKIAYINEALIWVRANS